MLSLKKKKNLFEVKQKQIFLVVEISTLIKAYSTD